jgi:hypothetical protein
MLCVLTKNGVQLPDTEIKLYNDRLKLLTGVYDSAKRINLRLSSPSYNLEAIAQKLAFFLHTEGKLAAEKSVMIEWAKKNRNVGFNYTEIETCIKELIDPCNILVPMTDDGEYGFGHLRFQEHLAAKELLTNRNIRFLPLFDQIWWRDVLLLFAQLNADLSWLLTEVGNNVKYNQVHTILDEMIRLRPENEQKKLKERLDVQVERSKIPDIDY